MQKDPSVVIELSGGGSGSGIKALNEQLTQIAMSSRKIKDKELKAAEEKGVKPFEIPVAVDAIVPIVNPKESLFGRLEKNLQGRNQELERRRRTRCSDCPGIQRYFFGNFWKLGISGHEKSARQPESTSAKLQRHRGSNRR